MINFEVNYHTPTAGGDCRQTPTSKPFIKYIGSQVGFCLRLSGAMSASDPGLLTSKPGAGELDFSQTLSDKTILSWRYNLREDA